MNREANSPGADAQTSNALLQQKMKKTVNDITLVKA